MAAPEVDIASQFHGVLTEELTPLRSTMLETNQNMSGLSIKFVQMESLLTNLCRTVDVLQGTISSPELRARTGGDNAAFVASTTASPVMATSQASMSTQEHALVSQLVARIEHLSADVSNYDATRQLREDNLLLRKDLQVLISMKAANRPVLLSNGCRNYGLCGVPAVNLLPQYY